MNFSALAEIGEEPELFATCKQFSWAELEEFYFYDILKPDPFVIVIDHISNGRVDRYPVKVEVDKDGSIKISFKKRVIRFASDGKLLPGSWGLMCNRMF